MKSLLYKILFLCLLYACKPSVYQVRSSQVSFQETNATLSEDAEANQIIAPYKKQLDAQMNQIIGYSEKELTISRKMNETLLGNLVADMTVQKARTLKKEVAFGFVTFGGLRTNLPAGAIKVSDVFELMPFENELVLLEVDGKIVKTLFEYLAKTRNMAISNSKVFIENGNIKDVLIDDEPIDEKKTYWIATSDYLANGGDNLHFLSQRTNTISTNVKIRDMIIESIKETHKQGKKIDATVGNRVLER
jgi:2',3'-cyclic-nucleotide 2'-phosphodiesterase (5'-nucleotidase family)